MLVKNIKNVKAKIMSAHGGTGLIQMKFFFQDYQRFRNDSDLGVPSPTYETANWNFFAYAELPIGSTIGPHKHLDNDEIYYILEGSAEITIDNKSRHIGAGDVVLTLHGSEHSIQKVTSNLKFIATEILINQ